MIRHNCLIPTLLPNDGTCTTARGLAGSCWSTCTVNLYPSSDLGSLLVNSLKCYLYYIINRIAL